MPFVVAVASPRHLFVAAGYNSGGVKICFPSEVRVRGLQVIKTCNDSPVSTNRATPLVATGSGIDDCFPFVPVGGALPRQLLIAAGDDGGRVEVGFTRDIRMSRRK